MSKIENMKTGNHQIKIYFHNRLCRTEYESRQLMSNKWLRNLKLNGTTWIIQKPALNKKVTKKNIRIKYNNHTKETNKHILSGI